MGEFENEIHKARISRIIDSYPNITHKAQTKLESARTFVRKNIKRLIVVGIVIFLLIPVVTYLYFLRDLGDKNSIMNRNNSGVQLQDDKGRVFFTFYNPKDLAIVPLSEISKNVQNAVIASEDKDFYKNPGFSFRGLARALINDITSGSIKEGGSTITQQLVKTALLNSNRN
ncbi:transglycosylase domain-containing protein, partial [Candidatus Curtissbacteria bacterium]|nr:transglycosylase domain-containing protein [Candidatus Curtissbacteria bacterium]